MSVFILFNIPPVVGTRNDVWVSVQVGVTSLIKAEIYTGTTLLTTLVMPPDVTGRVDFNLKKIIQCMGVMPNIIDAELPAFNQDIVTACTRNIKPFSLTIYEINRADDSVLHQVEMESICLLAGLNPEVSYGSGLLEYLGGPPRRFLTNKPLVKTTGKDTQEYLYYFNSNLDFNDAAVELMYHVYFTDGTSTGDMEYSSQVIGLSIIPAGYGQLEIESVVPDGKEVSHYEVFINDGEVATEKHVYEIDRRCYPNGREFLFQNSLGGMDTLKVMAVDEINLKRESETVERFMGFGTSITDGQYYEYNVQANREFKASTLLLHEGGRKWLQDFFASERVFEITDGQFLPVRITSNSVVINRSTDYMAVDFNYVYRFDDIGYTKL